MPLPPRLDIGATDGTRTGRPGAVTAVRFAALADPSSCVSVLSGDGFAHQSDYRASVRHDGATPLERQMRRGMEDIKALAEATVSVPA